MSSSQSRRSAVISLVETGQVHSQSDLVHLLGKAGFLVTQATASRDLEEIGALRGRRNDGVATYLLPREHSFPSELILSVESSANMAVVKTPPGGAQLLASALDRGSGIGAFINVIGTIAGDDTVLVISKKSDGGAALAKELLGIAQPSSSPSSTPSTAPSKVSSRKAKK
ncbi:MAG: arginine repressor [Streptomycetaceae bacterium]|nr:MAG: arginine repressor [Streptomycetaceae bacterium]